MDCPACGAPLPETGTECPGCGAAVGWYILKPAGEVYGPLDREMLDQCIREARLVTGDRLRFGDEGEFAPAHELIGERLAPPPAPVAPGRGAYAAPPSASGGGAVVKGCGVAVIICVVLGLLLFLISIPIVRGNRAKATTSTCMANLRQASAGVLMYVQDYDERFPPGLDWETVVYPYVRNQSVFVCPSYPNEKGYARNPKLDGVELQTIARRAECLLMWDAGALVSGVTVPPGATSPRHGADDHFAYTDGHVKASDPSAISGHLDPTGP